MITITATTKVSDIIDIRKPNNTTIGEIIDELHGYRSTNQLSEKFGLIQGDIKKLIFTLRRDTSIVNHIIENHDATEIKIRKSSTSNDVIISLNTRLPLKSRIIAYLKRQGRNGAVVKDIARNIGSTENTTYGCLVTHNNRNTFKKEKKPNQLGHVHYLKECIDNQIVNEDSRRIFEYDKIPLGFLLKIIVNGRLADDVVDISTEDNISRVTYRNHTMAELLSMFNMFNIIGINVQDQTSDIEVSIPIAK